MEAKPSHDQRRFKRANKRQNHERAQTSPQRPITLGASRRVRAQLAPDKPATLFDASYEKNLLVHRLVIPEKSHLNFSRLTTIT